MLGILAMSDIVIALAFNPAFAKFTTLEAVLKISLEEMKAVLDQSVMSVSCEHILGLTEVRKRYLKQSAHKMQRRLCYTPSRHGRRHVQPVGPWEILCVICHPLRAS